MIAQSKSSYGLSVCPKKSKKVYSFQMCKVCGKEFQSRHALFGHLRIHSGKNMRLIYYEKCGEEFGSMKSLINHRGLHRARVSEELRVRSSPSLAEESLNMSEALNLVHRRRSERNKYSASYCCSSFSSSHESSSSVSEIEYEDMKEAATCLMMLSDGLYDSGDFRKVPPDDDDDSVEFEIKSPNQNQQRVADHQLLKLKRDGEVLLSQSMDSSYGVMSRETDKAIENDFWDLHGKQGKIESGILVDNSLIYGIQLKQRETRSGFINSELHDACKTEPVAVPSSASNKRQKNPRDSCGYKCRTCQKVFSCHQALGGHKKLHKSTRSHAGSENQRVEGNSLRTQVLDMSNGITNKPRFVISLEASPQIKD